MIKQNLHTHTVYCDGRNTCEELINAAIQRGFSSLGFSGHAYTPLDTSYCMSRENTEKYCLEIDLLKEKYKNKIKIFKGIECDLYSDDKNHSYDYIIGSAHYIAKDGVLLPVDLSAAETRKIITEHFNGNPSAYVKAYFEEIKKIPEQINCHILGHFDLVTKFSDEIYDIDPHSAEFLKYATDAVYDIAEKLKIFEVNTGAISRGYRKVPYPSLTLLKEMKKAGMQPVVSSDCHSAADLDYGFNYARELLLAAGYKEMLYFTESGFTSCPI